MVVSLLLPVCDVDADEIHILCSPVSRNLVESAFFRARLYLHVVHLRDLLLVCTLRFVLAMIKRRLSLLPPALDLLASSIVTALAFL